MKILLTDDERLVRLSLKTMIEELVEKELIPPVELEEASSGSELEQKVESFRPHAAFVDIRMPGKSGLEAIESLHKRFPEICWIMLTGFTEFSFAKQAITLGVIDYLVKPASPDDILTTLVKAKSQLERAAKNESYAAERRMGSVYNGTLSSEFDSWFAHRRFVASIFIPGGTDRETGGKEMRSRILNTVEQRLVPWNFNWLTVGGTCGVLTSDSGNAAVTASINTEESVTDEFFTSYDQLMQSMPCDVEGEWFRTDETDSAELLFRNLHELEEQHIETAFPAIPDGDAGSELSLRRREQVERALELVHERYCSEIGLAQIADELNLTPNYLSTEFKRCTGVNFTEYITGLRMKHSLTLLKEPGMSVKQAASALGYVSSRYFSKLFFSSYGEKPSEYIESVRR